MTNEDGNEEFIVNDPNEDLTPEEQIAYAEAYSKFVTHFMEYVSTVDPSLFKRAKNYAIEYSGNDVIKFYDTEDGGG